jgi:bifunctional N-acetylglucosamine-1-phosphate-uridyltransferase/glucosamine-1-phosphate-acetyltransferase GlmU-like protein
MGKRKHQTHIGDGVFVGSNSKLVPPIEISRDGKRDHAAGARERIGIRARPPDD